MLGHFVLIVNVSCIMTAATTQKIIGNNVVTQPADIVSPNVVTSTSYSTTTIWTKHSQKYSTADALASTMSHTTSNINSAVKRLVGDDNSTFSHIPEHTSTMPAVKRDLPAVQTEPYTIAGSVIGAVIAIAVVIVVVVVCVRRKRVDVVNASRDDIPASECQPGKLNDIAPPQRVSSRTDGEQIAMVDNFLYTMSSGVVPRSVNTMNSEDVGERAIMTDNVVYESFPLDETKTEITELVV